MAEDREIASEDRPKVYLETSFMFYLSGDHYPAQLLGGLPP